jgi:glucokinase
MVLAVPDSSRRPVVGVDLGGTTTKVALVSADLELLAHDAVPTETSDQTRLLDSLEQAVTRIRGDVEIGGAGFGLPSQIDQRTGSVIDSINVPLVDVPIVEAMAQRLGVPVRIDNDANAACLAEARAGAARGSLDVVMLTLGTGVGGGLILNGELYRGWVGCGAELGHMVIDENGPRCQGHCPNRGCLEVMASAVGVVHAANAIADERPGGALAVERAAGFRLQARQVLDRALEGDRDCIDALAVVGRHLGVGIANYANIFNPEVIVIGGGMIVAGELLLGPARDEAARRALPASWTNTRVVPAELGNDAGVIGAAALML